MPGPHKVLIVNHAVEMGGAEKVLLRLIDSMDREAWPVALAAPEPGPLTEEMDARDVPVHYGFPRPRLLQVKRKSLGRSRLAQLLYPWDMARTVLSLARLIRREGYELVYTNSAKADIYGTIAGRLARRPVVWRLHDIVDTDAFSRLNVWLFVTAARYGAREVLAVSEPVRQALVARGVSAGRVVTIHNGVDPSVTCPARTREAVRAEFGLPLEAPVAGIVGRVVDWKGQALFVEAAARVSRALPEAHFLIVGDAVFGEKEYVDNLKARVRELGIEDKVVFTGLRADVPDLIGAMDLLVHASLLPDPLPTVILEAMTCGKPVLAPDAGGVPEMVIPGETGLLFPVGQEEPLAEAMLELLANPDRAHAMGERGYDRIVAEFDASRLARAMEAEWTDALEGKGKSACG